MRVNIKENESFFIWVGGQLWNHISKQIINGHFIFPIILYSNKSEKAIITRYDRADEFPQKLFFLQIFPFAYISVSIDYVCYRKSTEFGCEFTLISCWYTHTHTHTLVAQTWITRINQVKFKIFFTQLMLNSRYRWVEGNCDLSDESQKMGLVIKGILMHQSKIKMFFKFTKKNLILVYI
jgi:hypothetical protein